MRIAASSTTSPTAAIPLLPMATQTTSSGATFHAALAESSDRANADSRLNVAPKQQSGTGAVSRPASKPEKVQPVSNDNAIATAPTPVPPVDQKEASAKGSPADQENGTRIGDSSSQTATDSHVAVASADPSQQLPAAQPIEDTSEHVAAALQPLEVATSSNKPVVAAVEASALAAPVALDAVAPTTPAQTGAEIAAQSIAEAFRSQMVPPTATPLPAKADSIQSSGKAAQKTTTDAPGPKNSDPVIATDPAKAKAADAAGTSSDASSRNSQSNGQPAQHSQADASQPAIAMPKVTDSSVAQAQPIPNSAVAHQTSPATGATSVPQDLSHQGSSDTSSSALDGDEVAPATGINAARLVQTMNETEMQVGLHSTEFGAISIRTSVSQQQMLAQISLDHTGLSQAISAHVSSMQTKLGNDYGLNTLIQVNHQGSSAMGEHGGSQPRDQKAFAPSLPVQNDSVPADPDVGISPAALAGTSNGYRLDIRA